MFELNWQYEPATDLNWPLTDKLAACPREPDMLVYGLRLLTAMTLRIWLSTYHRLNIIGRENLPVSGSYVLVANHASHLDALCILSALKLSILRRAFPAAARDYFFVDLPRIAFSAVFINATPFSPRVVSSPQPGYLPAFIDAARQYPDSLPGRNALADRTTWRVSPGDRQSGRRIECAGDSLRAAGRGSRVAKGCHIPPTISGSSDDRRGADLFLARTLSRIRRANRRRPACGRGRALMQLSTHTMTTWDGAQLFYRAWAPEKPSGKAILLFHRGHEHSGFWQETVEGLKLDDIAFYAWDQRGHGQSDGERGHAPNVAAVIKDAETFARHLCAVHGFRLEETLVIAHSIGAVIAAGWVHDYAPPIRGMVLAAPAFRVRLYIPLAIPLLRLKQRLFGPGIVKSYVKASMLTHDRALVAAYEYDSMVFRQIAVNMLLDLHDTSTRLLKDAGAITVPTLMLAAGKDWVVDLYAQRAFYERLSSPIKQFEVLDGDYHSIFQETDRRETFQRVRTFVAACFARKTCGNGLLEADQGGYTRTEYDLLRSPGRWHWSLLRGFLKTIGRLSQGVNLGWETGFDSGLTLDYVYQNQTAGRTPIGRLIDYFYLNSIGWRGIRVRGTNLKAALRLCMQTLADAGRDVRILDIASGPGRYVLETMAAANSISASATLRDYQQQNLDAAAELAQKLGVDRVSTVLGDAFDRDSLAGVTPRPSIAIVSGLYELIPDNDRVRGSLEGIAAAMEADGHLIYTCQPWHPQVEFIARVLTNREGQPWIMRRRTQAEMDQLVAAAGFEKISQDIDPWGIFTVSVARKRST
jgi:alpha-beta hydrolase superfamily lysophospholipase